MHYHLSGVAAKGLATFGEHGCTTMLVFTLIGTNTLLNALLLLTGQALLATQAGIHHATDADVITDLYFGYSVPNSHAYSRKLMPGHAGVVSRANPRVVIRSFVHVAVTNAAVLHINQHIIWPNSTPLELHRLEVAGGVRASH
jgi:hypothetical protein